MRFFNRLRQQLLSGNRFSKYTLYAVGEILLVVIGILIALSIDNWNDERQLKNIERKYLIELKSNLQVDLDDVNHSISYTEDKIHSNQSVLNYLDGQKAFHDTLKHHFSNIHGSLHFTPQTSGIEGIRTAEGIRIIENDSIRKSLSYLYDYMYEHVIYIEKEDEHRFQYQILIPVLQENLRIHAWPGGAEPLDMEGIRNNPRFRNAIVTNLWYKHFLLSQYRVQHKTVRDLIHLIEKELVESAKY